MRSHDQIIIDAGGPSAVARKVGANPGTVKQWRRVGSIPAPYWQAFAQLNFATLDELAVAVAKGSGAVGHAPTVALVDGHGSENRVGNVSRTDEPGSSAASSALPDAA
ncbi:carph-isopro domain-containing protein, partial [Brevundimonas naejangsanensis]